MLCRRESENCTRTCQCKPSSAPAEIGKRLRARCSFHVEKEKIKRYITRRSNERIKLSRDRKLFSRRRTFANEVDGTFATESPIRSGRLRFKTRDDSFIVYTGGGFFLLTSVFVRRRNSGSRLPFLCLEKFDNFFFNAIAILSRPVF